MTEARRNVLLLSGCQAIFVTGTSLTVAISALVGLGLAPDPRLSTLPAGLQALAATVTTMPASLVMKRIGRRAGFALGVFVGGIGALLCCLALLRSDFVLLCAGTASLGVLAGVAQYYRFAAADAVDPLERPRAISWVLAGGLIAAFVGPNLASWTRESLAGPDFLGSFVALAGLQLLALALLAFVTLPLPSAEERSRGGRNLAKLILQPRYALAVWVALVASVTMSWLMTATPLAMGARGFQFHHTASVIQWHVVGMFAPALFSGGLVQRYGTLRVMMVGAAILAGSAIANLLGDSLWHFWLALAGLGVGWNLLFVAASALLTRTYTLPEKARAQGFNDLLVFGTVALAASTAGVLHEVIGWRAMNLWALPLAGTVLVLSARIYRRNQPRPSVVGGQ